MGTPVAFLKALRTIIPFGFCLFFISMGLLVFALRATRIHSADSCRTLYTHFPFESCPLCGFYGKPDQSFAPIAKAMA
jgi:hypothetical protein